MNAKVVISLDFELGWGVLEDPLWKEREDSGLYKNLRPVLSKLFNFLESTELPTTWATVSSMIIDNVSELSLDHLPDDYKDAAYTFFKESSWETHCAKDIFDSWNKISSFSELASHTSTHIYAEHPSVQSNHYIQDVKDSIDTLENYFSTPLSSLVFPRDQAKFRADVAKEFPLMFRLNPTFFSKKKNKFERIMLGGSKFIQNIPPSEIFLGSYGENYQTGSMYFNWSGGDFENLKKSLVKAQKRKLLKQISSSNSLFHIWLHPFNLAESPDHYKEFISFLTSLVELRDKGLIDIVNMRDVSTACDLRNIHEK